MNQVNKVCRITPAISQKGETDKEESAEPINARCEDSDFLRLGRWADPETRRSFLVPNNPLCYLLVLILALFMSGCSGINAGLQTAKDYRTQAVDAGAALNDDALNTAEFVICEGASIGAVRRKYGTPEGAVLWASLCNQSDSFMFMTPNIPIPEYPLMTPALGPRARHERTNE